ncbi:unnamed protein product [Ceratitis capitata]|uniref:(Mediterranean fruit fly) hypothetical protein n=1 Tax=Ceratitis capitata TaxID=7213 RepID=A0A811U6T2_CERCA|nr:unnamed protein product [Ceratitis capitata]
MWKCGNYIEIGMLWLLSCGVQCEWLAVPVPSSQRALPADAAETTAKRRYEWEVSAASVWLWWCRLN